MTLRRLVLAACCAWLAAGHPTAHAAPPFGPGHYDSLRWRCIGPFRGGRTVGAVGIGSIIAKLFFH